jgi:hypothetical protein
MAPAKARQRVMDNSMSAGWLNIDRLKSPSRPTWPAGARDQSPEAWWY